MIFEYTCSFAVQTQNRKRTFEQIECSSVSGASQSKKCSKTTHELALSPAKQNSTQDLNEPPLEVKFMYHLLLPFLFGVFSICIEKFFVKHITVFS